MPPPYHLHPIAVHFPAALLTVGLAAAVGARMRARPPWLADAAVGLFWTGFLGAWAAFGLGLLAEATAPHVPMAWETMYRHELLGRWTVGIFTVLALWRLRFGRRWERAWLAGWGAGVVVLLWTAALGGSLVFTYGVGVAE